MTNCLQDTYSSKAIDDYDMEQNNELAFSYHKQQIMILTTGAIAGRDCCAYVTGEVWGAKFESKIWELDCNATLVWPFPMIKNGL